MHIYSVSSYNTNNYSPYFGINLKSSKLNFKYDDFYIRIKGYGRHSEWAKKIKETADSAVSFIREKCNFEETLKKITAGVREANKIPLNIDKREHTGILRVKREGWEHGSSWDGFALITGYNSRNKYKTYADRLDFVVKHPLKNPYKDIGLTRPVRDLDFGKFLDHGNARYINNAFTYINNLFNKIHSKYIAEEITEEGLSNANAMIAEIRWILAHATPWERGSDAISNTFIRSIYKAMGVKTYPLKKGISLDLEAYCTNLEDYKKNFCSYFSKKPKIIE